MELGVNEKISQLEATINRMEKAMITKPEGSEGRSMCTSTLAKLEFTKFSGEDPTEWFMRVKQFFQYQGTMNNQKVSMASYHMVGEANQWWQWLCRAYGEEEKEVTWEIFEQELWARFGPIENEDFDEALSKTKQTGSLRDFQQKFRRLGNRVQGWTQKALVGTFMGGLKSEIADGIRMFKPKTVKEVTSLVRMRDEHLSHQKKTTPDAFGMLGTIATGVVIDAYGPMTMLDA
uniref:Retrotransposon gag domain-containing protein n=1 Tax=Tanacetum cinerariifolium TaxID=118510 RepID=A0A699GS10_TANCI|nr:hypothetical protein VITISV_041623 [Tanacetum cinerariifolium]